VSTATPIGDAQRERDAAVAMLRELCRPFQGSDALIPECVVVQPNEIPHPTDALLVHHEHMTEVLQRRYARPVDLHVLEEHLDGDRYTRRIILTPSNDDGAKGGMVVEWGIMRLDFRFMSEAVRKEILAKQSPLGEILIRHNVHRRIKPRWFMRFAPRGPLAIFGEDGAVESLYGRIGTIYCDEKPAIELLEIVTA